jgi:hypothetical protein
MNWYSRITQDIANIPPAILWYEGELEEARKQTRLFGNLEKQVWGCWQMYQVTEKQWHVLKIRPLM